MGTTIAKFYESIGDFRRDLDTLTPKHSERTASAWNGNESWDQAKQSLLKGRMSVVPKAAKLMDKLAANSIELTTSQWEQSVAGYIPCVPAFLAGHPDNMYRLTDVETDRSPVRIFASVCVSAGIDADDLEKRGTAILALCQKLGSVRPIELYAYADMGGRGWACMPCVKIETSPLDLATATYALSAPAFLRQLCFGWANQYGWSGQWAWDESPQSAESRRRTSELLRITDSDLLIPGGFATDPLIRKPVEWINEQVARFTETLETA
jgi:hypothetical protein